MTALFLTAAGAVLYLAIGLACALAWTLACFVEEGEFATARECAAVAVGWPVAVWRLWRGAR